MTPRLKTDEKLRRFVNDARLTHTLHLSTFAELLARHPRQPATKRLLPFVDKPAGMTRSELEDLFVDFAHPTGCRNRQSTSDGGGVSRTSCSPKST